MKKKLPTQSDPNMQKLLEVCNDIGQLCDDIKKLFGHDVSIIQHINNVESIYKVDASKIFNEAVINFQTLLEELYISSNNYIIIPYTTKLFSDMKEKITKIYKFIQEKKSVYIDKEAPYTYLNLNAIIKKIDSRMNELHPSSSRSSPKP